MAVSTPNNRATSTLLWFDLGESDAREVQQLSARERRVAGLPKGGVRPARLCEPHEHRLITESSPPAVNATSPDELQPAAGGGGELRGSKSRKSNTFFCRVRPVAHSPRAAKPLGEEAGDLKVARARLIRRPILRNSSSARPPRAANTSLLALSFSGCRQRRRNRGCESVIALASRSLRGPQQR